MEISKGVLLGIIIQEASFSSSMDKIHIPVLLLTASRHFTVVLPAVAMMNIQRLLPLQGLPTSGPMTIESTLSCPLQSKSKMASSSFS